MRANLDQKSSSFLRRTVANRVAALCFVACIPVWSGCAAFRPVDGIPARYIPNEVKSASRSGRKTIDLSLLRQTPPVEYRIDHGDVLGVYIEGVLGKSDQIPPVHFPTAADVPPSMGFPIPVREDGTISLPLVGALHVRGLTVREIEDAIRSAFTLDRRILQSGRERILVSVQKPRTFQVLVIRQEAGIETVGGGAGGGGFNPGASKRGTGQVVTMPAYKNDVLHALAQTGGLPGLDAENAIYIVRNGSRQQIDELATQGRDLSWSSWGHSMRKMSNASPIVQVGAAATQSLIDTTPTIDNSNVTKIPVRLSRGEMINFTEDDIILNDGDIVFIESRETEIFYTGGLLGGGQFTLPRDYDLDVLGAIAIAQSQNAQQGGNGRALGGTSALNQDVTIGASNVIVLRRLANGQQVPIKVDLYKAKMNPNENILIQPGDYVMLQYTRSEAIAAFFERHILEGAIFGLAAGQINR